MGVTKMRCVKAFLIVVSSIILSLLLLLLSNDSGDLHCDKHMLNWKTLASDDKILDVQFVEDNSDRRDQKASVSLSLHYMDQITWGARRLRSLQCWAAQLDRTMRVVEPSMNNTYFGAPLITPVDEITKFRDIFDIEVWNQYGKQEGYDSLVSWSEFSVNAPRETILVQIIYKKDKMCVDPSSQSANCTLHEVKQYWSDTLEQFSFSVIREVCIDFRYVDTVQTKDFNEYIFGDIARDTPVTIVFNEWRGPLQKKLSGDNNCILRIRDQNCTPSGPTGLMHNLTLNALRPTLEIHHLAEAYTEKYLNRNSKYLAIMVRWELMFLKKLYLRRQWRHPNECIGEISKYVRKFGMNSTFLATDAGRHGSGTMQHEYTIRGTLYSSRNLTEKLLNVLHGRPITLEEYDKQFEDITGTSVSPTYHIPQLQKAIAARAECLLLVGWGSFHESTLALYKNLHDDEGECYKELPFC